MINYHQSDEIFSKTDIIRATGKLSKNQIGKPKPKHTDKMNKSIH